MKKYGVCYSSCIYRPFHLLNGFGDSKPLYYRTRKAAEAAAKEIRTYGKGWSAFVVEIPQRIAGVVGP